MPTREGDHGLRDIPGTDAPRDRPGRRVSGDVRAGGRGGGVGARHRLAGRDADQPGPLGAVGPPPRRELDRRPDPARAHGHGRAAPALEPSPARRRRGHHARPPEPGALRFRHRPERRHAGLRRPRRPVRGKPGALLRGARDHPRGVEGRAVQLRRPLLSVHRRHRLPSPGISGRTRRCGWPPPRRTRFPAWAGWACRSSSGCAAWTFPSWPAACAPIARRGARRGIPAMATRACASRSTPPRPTRPPAKSRATPSPTTSSVRRTSRWRRSGEPGRARWSSARPRPSAWRALSYDAILARKVAFGTGPALVDRLGQLREELAVTGVAAELNPGGLLPTAQELRSLEILTKQVMPAFK